MNKDKIIVALDVDTDTEAFDLVDKLPSISCFKVGWQLFANGGLNVVQSLSDHGIDVFLDLKINDIPNTVERTVRTLTQCERIKFFTFQGTALTLSALRLGCTNDFTKFLYVPVLSSQSVYKLDYKLALSKISAGVLDGIVASGERIDWARSNGSELIIVAPGIRLHRGSEDHFVTSTPLEAFNRGADYIVIGREITQADDPEKALEECCNSVY